MGDIVTPVLLFGFMFGVVGGAAALALKYRRHAKRTQRVLDETHDDDVCVACNGDQVSELGPQAFRCDGCSFTWGSGLGQLRADAQRQRIEAMSDDERRQAGLNDLGQAKLLLVAATGTIETALEVSRADLDGATDNRAAEKHQTIALGLTQAREAREHIVAAKMKLVGAPSNTLDVLDVDFIDLGADHYLFDAFDFSVAAGGIAILDVQIGDREIHDELEKLVRRVRDMLASVERALVVSG